MHDPPLSIFACSIHYYRAISRSRPRPPFSTFVGSNLRFSPDDTKSETGNPRTSQLRFFRLVDPEPLSPMRHFRKERKKTLERRRRLPIPGGIFQQDACLYPFPWNFPKKIIIRGEHRNRSGNLDWNPGFFWGCENSANSWWSSLSTSALDSARLLMRPEPERSESRPFS